MSEVTDAQLVLVRHGETTGESSIRLNGSTDVPLSELGRAQMRAVRDSLAHWTFTHVLTSPLSRATEAAAIIAPYAASLPVVDFREMDFGQWETLTYAEVQQRDPEGLAQMRTSTGDFRFPGGDSRLGFFNRVAAAATQWIKPDRTTLIAAHKGTIKAITAALLPGYDWTIARQEPCDLGSIHRFAPEPAADGTIRWSRRISNDVGHLGELASGC